MLNYATIASLFFVFSWVYLMYQRRSPKIYPPGPKGLPILGNLFDIPKSLAYKTYARWSKELGSDILYLNAAGTSIIVLNSIEKAEDLFQKRSSIYSSRPHMTMISELLEGTRFLAMMPYGDEWREGRRLFQKYVPPSDQHHYQTRELEFVRKFLLPNLLDTPDKFSDHIRHAIGGSIISLAYGVPIRRLNDQWIKLAEDGLTLMTKTAIPGKYIVDAIPVMKYLPEWIPGAKFQKEAREGRQVMRRFFRAPFDASKAMSERAAKGNFVSKLLETLKNAPDSNSAKKQVMVENIAGMFIAGGTDSTVAAIMSLVLAMAHHPDIQLKVQKEIDTVIGTERLPDFHDKPQLLYLCAVLKEVFQWAPIVPQGNAHASTKDDVYQGYYIPKGSISLQMLGSFLILINNPATNAGIADHNIIRAMLNDERVFPNLSVFDPERFLTNGKLQFDAPDPDIVATFGFGRRTCPGSHIALSSFWITAASILSVFNIVKSRDEDGNEIQPKVEYMGRGAVGHPEPFECVFTPRSKTAEFLIRAELDGESIDFI